MNFLEERIVKDGVVKPGNVLKVDSFLNHQMDISLMEEIGREFKRRFSDKTCSFHSDEPIRPSRRVPHSRGCECQ